MLGAQLRPRVVEVREVAGCHVHRADGHARLARIDAVEVAKAFERSLERSRIVIARGLRRTRCHRRRRRKAGHEEPLLPFDERIDRLQRGKSLSDLVARIEERALDERGQRKAERRLTDGFPEFPQPLDAILRRISRDDRCVDRADRDAGDPVRVNIRFVQALVDAGLIRAERAAALKHERDGLVGRQAHARRLFVAAFASEGWVVVAF